MVIDILELLDKDFKETMIKMLQQTIADMLETNEKIGIFRREIESLRRNSR